MTATVRSHKEDGSIIKEYICDYDKTVEYKNESINEVNFHIVKALMESDDVNYISIEEEDGSTWSPF